MEVLKIEELKKELFIGDLGEYFRDYDNGYICDIITEISDNHVDIYNYDLLEWAKNNYGYIEEAIDNLGTPTNDKGHFDFMRCIMQGQFYSYEQDIYENLEDILKFFMYDYIEKELNLLELTEEQNENLLDWDFSDNNEQLENLIKHINEVLEV